MYYQQNVKVMTVTCSDMCITAVLKCMCHFTAVHNVDLGN